MNDFIDVTENQKDDYNKVVNHPLQSYEWGEFREKTGVKVIRRALIKNGKITDGFTLTLHKIPGFSSFIGYLPKGNSPTEEILGELERIGKEYNCVYIQLEPNIEQSQMVNDKVENKWKMENGKWKMTPSFHPLFTRYTFILDLQPSEDELFKNLHQKTRYNIRVAQKHGVEIQEDNSEDAFETYWKIMEETTTRQKFYTHTKNYHHFQWELFAKQKNFDPNQLGYHLMLAHYEKKILAAWVLFTYHNTLYYPYGSSSSENRETMASNLMMWEAIKYGKKLGLKKFDMWGSLGPEPDTKDPWYGFHRFKQGYGATLTEFVGSYDLIINPAMYQVVKLADKVRWVYLRLKK